MSLSSNSALLYLSVLMFYVRAGSVDALSPPRVVVLIIRESVTWSQTFRLCTYKGQSRSRSRTSLCTLLYTYITFHNTLFVLTQIFVYVQQSMDQSCVWSNRAIIQVQSMSGRRCKVLMSDQFEYYRHFQRYIS